MAVTQVYQPTTMYGGFGSATWTFPSYTSGDLLIVQAIIQDNTKDLVATGADLTAITDWLTMATSDRTRFYYRYLDNTESADLTLTQSAENITFVPMIFRGVSGAPTATQSQTLSTSTSATPQDVSANSGDLVLAIVTGSDDFEITVPAGLTDAFDRASSSFTSTRGNDNAFAAGWKEATSTGTQTFSAFTTSTGIAYGTVSVVFAGAGGPTTHTVTASGAATSDGTATIVMATTQSASGSTTTGGAAAIATVTTMSAGGAATSDGTATIGLRLPASAAGSTTTNGSATLSATLPLSATGSATVSGSAAINLGAVDHALSAAGAATTGGAAGLALSIPLSAAGAATGGGGAAITTTAGLSASGSATTGGSAAISAALPASAAGSATTGGSAALSALLPVTASGSATTGGSASMTIGAVDHALSATGSTTTGGSAGISCTRSLSASGSATLAGLAGVLCTRALSASGSATLTGSAAIVLAAPTALSVTASGLVTTSGSAAIVLVVPIDPSTLPPTLTRLYSGTSESPRRRRPLEGTSLSRLR